MELGVWSWLCVGGWLRVCVCVWRYVKEGKGEVRGEGWRGVETSGKGRGTPHCVRRHNIQSSDFGERRTMTLWITRFALLAGMAVVAACWVDILTFLVMVVVPCLVVRFSFL